MKYALVKNGVVVDRAQIDPAKVFYPEYAAQFIPAPDDVDTGWLYDGTNFTAPPVPEPIAASATPTKEELMAQLAALSAQIQALE
jgi:hypothetical protein